MPTNPEAAGHLAELDARFEGHLAALRERTVQAKDAINAGAEALGPRRYPPKHPTTRIDLGDPPDRPLLADTPLLPADDDGAPLWDDPAPNP